VSLLEFPDLGLVEGDGAIGFPWNNVVKHLH